MVEVDIAVGVRSIKALIKEAPRGWSPNYRGCWDASFVLCRPSDPPAAW